MKLNLCSGFAGAIVMLAVATPAFAQDAADPEPFTGVYIGAAGGYDIQPNDVGSTVLFDRNLDGRFGDTVTTAAGANAFSPGFCNGAARAHSPIFGCYNDKDGWSYYGRVGADHQFGRIVVGVVGEFGKSEIEDSTSAFSTTPAAYVLTRYVDWEASIRGRVGYAADRTLFYGTFGPGYVRITPGFGTTNTVNDFRGSGKNTEWGATFGGGIEQKISKHISIGMEYIGHRYRDDDYRARAVAGSAPATNPFILPPNTTGTDFQRSDEIFRWHSIRGTIAYRF